MVVGKSNFDKMVEDVIASFMIDFIVVDKGVVFSARDKMSSLGKVKKRSISLGDSKYNGKGCK